MPLQALFAHLGRAEMQRVTLPAEVEQRYLGGRGSAAWLLNTRLAPNTPPLGPENMLVFSAGALAGMPGYANGGFVASSRSPLTGAIAHSWANGHFGTALRCAGLDLLVLEGQASEWSFLLIDGPNASLRSARRLLGLDTQQTSEALREAFGDDLLVACLGPAGENGVAYSSIVAEGRFAAEPAGTGAVMASKRLKAIAIRMGPLLQPADQTRLQDLLQQISQRAEQSNLAEQIRQFGSSYFVNPAHEWGALTGRNGQDGRIAHILAISRSTLSLRGKQQSHSCQGCPVPCYSDYVRKNGALLPRPELEAIAGFGARCGIASPDALIAAADLCLRLGLDTASTAAAVAFLCECQQQGLNSAGTLNWGDDDAILAAIERLGQRQEKRDVLSLGVGEMQEIFFGSAAFAPHVRGLASPALDPRALQAVALAQATAPIGGDQRYAMIYEELVDESPEWLPDEPSHPQAVKGKVSSLIWHERYAAALDASGMCRRLALMAYQLAPVELTELLVAATGRVISGGELARLGERIVTLERLFALREHAGNDGLPTRWSEQTLRDGRAAGHLPALQDLLPEYYRRHGWDVRGVPTRERLSELEIEL